MILISHRGNIDGRIPNRENHPDYINEGQNDYLKAEVNIYFKRKI